MGFLLYLGLRKYYHRMNSIKVTYSLDSHHLCHISREKEYSSTFLYNSTNRFIIILFKEEASKCENDIEK